MTPPGFRRSLLSPPHSFSFSLTQTRKHVHTVRSASETLKNSGMVCSCVISGRGLTSWAACTVRSMASCILSETSVRLRWLLFTDPMISFIKVITGIWRLCIRAGTKKRQITNIMKGSNKQPKLITKQRLQIWCVIYTKYCITYFRLGLNDSQK